MAVALTLLIGAGLLIRSFAEIQRVDPGFDPQGVLTAGIALPAARYETPQERIAFLDEVIASLEALPGVRSVGTTSDVPFGGGMSNRSFAIEGVVVPPEGQNPWGQYRVVEAGYHRTMGIRLVAGRYFERSDRADSGPVAIVDEEMVRRYWPSEDPIGKRLAYPMNEETGEPIWIEVVGVVEHTANASLDEDRMVQLYRPFHQTAGSYFTLTLRTGGNPTQLVPALRQVVRSVVPDQPVANVATMHQRLDDAVGQRRFTMLLLGIFAGVALTLASVGIYGVIAFDVTRRVPELGLRMALGAKRTSLLSLVLGRGLRRTLVGVGIGLLGALAVTRALESQLYGVSTTDPWTFGTVAALLVGVALLAALLPALRATRVNPMVALRAE